MGEPRVRARHLQLYLGQLQRLEPLVVPEVEGLLGQNTVRSIRHSLALAWLPARLDVEVLEATAQASSRAQALEVIRARKYAALNSQPLRSFMHSVTRLSNGAPDLALRPLIRGWGLVFKNMGNVRILLTQPDHFVVQFSALPSRFLASALWMDALPVALNVLFSVMNREGSCRWRSINPDLGGGLIVARW